MAAPVQTRTIESASVFGSVRWKPDFLPNNLSRGLRYDHTRQTAVQREGQLDLGGGSILYYTDARLRSTDDALMPRFSLTWEPANDTTVYLTVARGYIPGGFNLAATQEGNLVHGNGPRRRLNAFARMFAALKGAPVHRLAGARLRRLQNDELERIGRESD